MTRSHPIRCAKAIRAVAAFGPGAGVGHPHAKLAASLGWWSAGPIKDPSELAGALKRAVEVVRAGEPALVDVWTQPR